MKIQVADLHNDLLSYLIHKEGRTPFEDVSRSSITQMQAGGIAHQVLVIWTVTGQSSRLQGERQLTAYRTLIKDHPFFLLAVENASGFADEDEPLKKVFDRLDGMGPLVYVSLTWDGENRFGGGVGSKAGLKDEGKELLRKMSERGIAVDLSHASDRLAYEILAFIDRENLTIPVMASHSNFRDVKDKARNLPRELAEEIIRREGLIGLNFFAPFLGERGIFAHIEYALKLGGVHALAFGADFFPPEDYPSLALKYPGEVHFIESLGNSSCYPALLDEILERGLLNEEGLKKVASGNFLEFRKRNLS